MWPILDHYYNVFIMYAKHASVWPKIHWKRARPFTRLPPENSRELNNGQKCILLNLMTLVSWTKVDFFTFLFFIEACILWLFPIVSIAYLLRSGSHTVQQCPGKIFSPFSFWTYMHLCEVTFRLKQALLKTSYHSKKLNSTFDTSWVASKVQHYKLLHRA